MVMVSNDFLLTFFKRFILSNIAVYFKEVH